MFHVPIGQLIYEWDQTLEEVNVYISPPPGVKANDIDCQITTSSVRVGLKGNPPFLEVGSVHSLPTSSSEQG